MAVVLNGSTIRSTAALHFATGLGSSYQYEYYSLLIFLVSPFLQAQHIYGGKQKSSNVCVRSSHRVSSLRYEVYNRLVVVLTVVVAVFFFSIERDWARSYCRRGVYRVWYDMVAEVGMDEWMGGRFFFLCCSVVCFLFSG